MLSLPGKKEAWDPPFLLQPDVKTRLSGVRLLPARAGKSSLEAQGASCCSANRKLRHASQERTDLKMDMETPPSGAYFTAESGPRPGEAPPVGPLPAAPSHPAFRPLDGWFAAACLVFAYMGVHWYFFGGYGYGTTLLFLCLAAGAGLYLHGKGCPLGRAWWTGLGLLLLFCLPFSLYAPSPVLVFTALFLLLLLTLWTARAAAGDGRSLLRRHWLADQARALLLYPFGALGAAFQAIAALFRRLPAGKAVRRVLLGLLLALPVTALAGVLLFRADAAFAGLLTQIGESLFGRLEWDLPLTFVRLGLSVVGGILLFSLFTSSLRRPHPETFTDAGMDTLRGQLQLVSPTVVITALTPVCLLYLLFVVSQSAYFFSAFRDCLPAGFTYADYARRGFFELCMVAVLNMGLIALLSLFCRREGKRPAAVRVFTLALSLFTLLFIAVDLRKMLLYIDRYGLTPLRVYTSWFMLLLAAVFLVLMVQQFRERLHLVRWLGAIFLVFFAVLNFADVDARIAEYNVAQYRSGRLETVDVSLLQSLSDSAIPAVYPLLSDEDEQVSEQARAVYRAAYKRLRQKPAIQGSLASHRAMRALESALAEGLFQLENGWPQSEPAAPENGFSTSADDFSAVRASGSAD